jgi:hypothetical protein
MDAEVVEDEQVRLKVAAEGRLEAVVGAGPAQVPQQQVGAAEFA